MSEEQVIGLLRSIYILATLPYPFPDDSTVDSRLCLALGEILGIANKALSGVDIKDLGLLRVPLP